MPGARSYDNGDSLTPRKEYRVDVLAADADDPTDEAIPVIDTRYNQMNYDQDAQPAIYGRNAQLDVCAWFSTGIKTATLKVYLLAAVELKETPQPAVVVRWVLAATVSVTGNSLNVVKDLPPGQYKILVTALGSGAHLDLLTQYAA